MNDEFREANEDFTGMVEKYKSLKSGWLNAVETEIFSDGRELTRKILQGHVNCRGSGDAGQSITTTDGEILKHRRLQKRSLQTMFGKIEITRIGYSNRKHPALFPLDALLNLPKSSFSYGLQRFVARHASSDSFSEVIDLTLDVTGIKIGLRQTMQIVESCAHDFDDFYSTNKKETEVESDILVLTTDAKGIVMRHESLRDETKKQAESKTHKMKNRLSRGEKANRKRMAQVASIYFISCFKRNPEDILDELKRKEIKAKKSIRPRPKQKRVWASVEKNANEVIEHMFEEAEKRDPLHQKNWVVLIDGNKHQLQLVKSLSKQKNVKTSIILDIIHVIEYLWTAARVFINEKNHSECDAWVTNKLRDILSGKAGKVAGSIRMSAAKRNLTNTKKKTASDCARYIANHKSYMNYDYYLSHGYPIATGVIEGACRYLVKDRMDITGARWSLSGAESVLKLRSLVSSGDFDEYWDFHLNCEYERNYKEKIAGLDQLQDKFSS